MPRKTSPRRAVRPPPKQRHSGMATAMSLKRELGNRGSGDLHFDHLERRVRTRRGHKRKRHVVDRNAGSGAAFEPPVVRVPVERGSHLVAIERLLQTARAEE